MKHSLAAAFMASLIPCITLASTVRAPAKTPDRTIPVNIAIVTPDTVILGPDQIIVETSPQERNILLSTKFLSYTFKQTISCSDAVKIARGEADNSFAREFKARIELSGVTAMNLLLKNSAAPSYEIRGNISEFHAYAKLSLAIADELATHTQSAIKATEAYCLAHK